MSEIPFTTADPSHPWPSFIPDELPDFVLMAVAMIDIRELDEDCPPDMAGAGIQVVVNCPLEQAVAGLRGLLVKMERDLHRLQTARHN